MGIKKSGKAFKVIELSLCLITVLFMLSSILMSDTQAQPIPCAIYGYVKNVTKNLRRKYIIENR